MRLTTSNYVKLTLAFTLVYLPKKKKKSKHHEVLTDLKILMTKENCCELYPLYLSSVLI